MYDYKGKTEWINMNANQETKKKSVEFMSEELRNFQDIAAYIKPMSGEVPSISGIDICGEVFPYNGVIGGDHIIYVDFNKRYDLDHRIEEARGRGAKEIVQCLESNRKKAGVLVADVSGHHITDALLAAMLHQAFLTGVQYELKHNGEVTANLFEILNTRFFNSSSFRKFITLLYGEIHENGKFRFISAGHPVPVVFSNEYDKLMPICNERMVRFPPMGTLPSGEDVDCSRNWSRLGYKKKYSVNEINLMGNGDILVLYTDGLSEHGIDLDENYFPNRLEQALREVKHLNAKEICTHLKNDVMDFGPASDDISIVVIKRL